MRDEPAPHSHEKIRTGNEPMGRDWSGQGAERADLRGHGHDSQRKAMLRQCGDERRLAKNRRSVAKIGCALAKLRRDTQRFEPAKHGNAP